MLLLIRRKNNSRHKNYVDSTLFNDAHDIPENVVIIYILGQLKDNELEVYFGDLLKTNIYFKERINDYKYFLKQNNINSLEEYDAIINEVTNRLYTNIIREVVKQDKSHQMPKSSLNNCK